MPAARTRLCKGGERFFPLQSDFRSTFYCTEYGRSECHEGSRHLAPDLHHVRMGHGCLRGVR